MLSRELGDVALHIEADELGAAALEVLLGQDAALRAEAVGGVGTESFDFQDADFEGVARFGALDVDGPVRMWPPGPLSLTSAKMAFSSGWISDSLQAGIDQAVGLLVVMVWISTVSPDLMVRTGLAADQ